MIFDMFKAYLFILIMSNALIADRPCLNITDDSWIPTSALIKGFVASVASGLVFGTYDRINHESAEAYGRYWIENGPFIFLMAGLPGSIYFGYKTKSLCETGIIVSTVLSGMSTGLFAVYALSR